MQVQHLYNYLNERFCGRVVCYRCSASRHALPRDRIVHNPFNGSSDTSESQLHRVCDTCVPDVLGLAAPISDLLIPGTSGEPLSISQPAVTARIDAQDPAGSEIDDRFLVECPVCRTDLRIFGDDDLQAIHVATCLEGHSTSPSFSGGSRHLGIKRLYDILTSQVYRLQEGSSLIGTECVICFEEFEVKPSSPVVLTLRLVTGYLGRNVCVIFIGVVFAIGYGSAMVAPCISLEVRIYRHGVWTDSIGQRIWAGITFITRVRVFTFTWHLTTSGIL